MDIERYIEVNTTLGRVDIEKGNQHYFTKLASLYEIGIGRIDWKKNGFEKYISIENLSKENKLARLEEFCTSVLLGMSTNNSVKIFADGYLEDVYLIPSDFLTDFLKYCIDLPQHLYVLFENESCLNYTWEEDLFFGYPKNYKNQRFAITGRKA